jgi:UDPglucose--hexose-1-phosphate uridylyltransferase
MVLEYRLEPTKKQLVIVANERSGRPLVFGKTKVTCPFDKGVEKVTPPTKLALPNERQWRTRVFDNAFAFLKRRGKFKPMKQGELYWTSPAFGDHEVIVESDVHGALYQELGDEQLQLVLETYQKRFRTLSAQKGVECTYLFKNHGQKAGASIDHEHSQIVTLPFVPPVIKEELEANKRAGTCLHCALLKREKKNVLAKQGAFTAVCPSFARFPFETWIVANEHIRSFTEFSAGDNRDFMRLLRDVVARVYGVSHDYNVLYHNSPRTGELHFHAEVCPRPSVWAGFELGTGVLVNPKSTEEALAALRAVQV